jgi:predicted RNA-binding Zn-ribbon protein involved in translation (DUF1610 family)
MPQSRAALKARMMAEAEALIDRMLADKTPANKIKLTEIEAAAIQIGQGMQVTVARELVRDSQAESSEVPVCTSCGRKMRMKGYRKRQVETEAGLVEMARGYYYCTSCGCGVFPPG